MPKWSPRLVLAVLVAAVLVARSRGAVYRWVAPADDVAGTAHGGAFDVESNWDPPGLPAPTDDLLVAGTVGSGASYAPLNFTSLYGVFRARRITLDHGEIILPLTPASGRLSVTHDLLAIGECVVSEAMAWGSNGGGDEGGSAEGGPAASVRTLGVQDEAEVEIEAAITAATFNASTMSRVSVGATLRLTHSLVVGDRGVVVMERASILPPTMRLTTAGQVFLSGPHGTTHQTNASVNSELYLDDALGGNIFDVSSGATMLVTGGLNVRGTSAPFVSGLLRLQRTGRLYRVDGDMQIQSDSSVFIEDGGSFLVGSAARVDFRSSPYGGGRVLCDGVCSLVSNGGRAWEVQLISYPGSIVEFLASTTFRRRLAISGWAVGTTTLTMERGSTFDADYLGGLVVESQASLGGSIGGIVFGQAGSIMHKIAASALSIRTLFFDDETVTLVVPASGKLPVHVEDGIWSNGGTLVVDASSLAERDLNGEVVLITAEDTYDDFGNILIIGLGDARGGTVVRISNEILSYVFVYWELAPAGPTRDPPNAGPDGPFVAPAAMLTEGGEAETSSGVAVAGLVIVLASAAVAVVGCLSMIVIRAVKAQPPLPLEGGRPTGRREEAEGGGGSDDSGSEDDGASASAAAGRPVWHSSRDDDELELGSAARASDDLESSTLQEPEGLPPSSVSSARGSSTGSST